MFTYISRAQQLLTLGNAGGIGFVLGVFPAGQDTGLLHWLVLGAIVSYMLGVLCTVLGMALVCTIVIKEAHIAETAMTQFIEDDISCFDVSTIADKQAFKLAPSAAAASILGALFFIVGAVITLVLLAIFN